MSDPNQNSIFTKAAGIYGEQNPYGPSAAAVQAVQSVPQQQPAPRPSGFMGTAGKLAYLGSQFLEGLQRGKMQNYLNQEAAKNSQYQGEMAALMARRADSTPEQQVVIDQAMGKLAAAHYSGLTQEQKGASGQGGQGGQKQGKQAKGDQTAGGQLKSFFGNIFNALGGPTPAKSGDLTSVIKDIHADMDRIGSPNRLDMVRQTKSGAQYALDAIKDTPGFTIEDASNNSSFNKALDQYASLWPAEEQIKRRDELKTSMLSGLPGYGTSQAAQRRAEAEGATPSGPPTMNAPREMAGLPLASGMLLGSKTAAQRAVVLPETVTEKQMSLWESVNKWVTDPKQFEYIDKDGHKNTGVAKLVTIPGSGSRRYVQNADFSFYSPNPASMQEVGVAQHTEAHLTEKQKQDNTDAYNTWAGLHGHQPVTEIQKTQARNDQYRERHPLTSPEALKGELGQLEEAYRTIEKAKDPLNKVPKSSLDAAKKFIQKVDTGMGAENQELLSQYGKILEGVEAFNGDADKQLDLIKKSEWVDQNGVKKTGADLFALTRGMLYGNVPMDHAAAFARAASTGRYGDPEVYAAFKLTMAINPYWTPAKYRLKADNLASFSLGKKNGQANLMIQNALAHLDRLNETAKKLDMKDIMVYNSLSLIGREQWGNTDVAKYFTDIAPAAQDLANAILGHPGHKEEQAEWRKRLNNAYTSEQMQVVIKELISETLWARLQNMNDEFTGIMDYPAGNLLLSERNIERFKRYGVPDDQIDQVMGESQAPDFFNVGANPPATPKKAPAAQPKDPTKGDGFPGH